MTFLSNGLIGWNIEKRVVLHIRKIRGLEVRLEQLLPLHASATQAELGELFDPRIERPCLK